MRFLSPSERLFLSAVSNLGYCNPFLPERIEYERQALGPDFQEGEPVWSLRVKDPQEAHVNSWKVSEKVEASIDRLKERLAAGTDPREQDLILYEDAVLYLLYYRYLAPVSQAALRPSREKRGPDRWSSYGEFLRDWDRYLKVPGIELPTRHEPAHTLACFFQIRRAFDHIFTHIIGGSMSAARLRASVWQSIFTHDIRRYRRTLYNRMGDFATLITGPSGTGKELVARAIALSRYIPFDEKNLRFEGDGDDSFHAINLAALSPALIESELFGHRRGAFTGAIGDRRGWLETCPPRGTVFLDEIGDLDPSIQVKLLRVIETRTFQPVGDTTSRRFEGKLMAATHRDLPEAMRRGQFREDLYYRLCSDQIVTPSLREQIQESPRVLSELILFMARKVAGPEAENLALEVEAWVPENLGSQYAWPGNYRELEQCVRNMLIRKQYRPPQVGRDPGTGEFFADIKHGKLTADQLLRRYATLVYSATGSYQETARRLQIDRRTVKSKIDLELLDRLRPAS